MKKVAVVAMVAMMVASVAGCWGPQIVTRSFDDWLNQGYTDIPWLYGNTIAAGIWGIVFWVTGVVDTFVNAYYFWVKDAQPFGSGTGTKFDHKAVTPKK
jgi:hypothetical protein